MSSVSIAQEKSPSMVVVWSMWALASFFYFFQYIMRVCPSVMLNDVMRHFAVDAADFGRFSAAYYVGYALFHIPIGIALDRFPLRWVMAGSIFSAVLGMVPFALSDHWALTVIGRFLVGAGSTGAILGVFKTVRLYFREDWFARLLGVSVTIGLLGGIYGSAPVAQLVNDFGWQNVALGLIAVGTTLGIAILLICPREAGVVSMEPESKSIFASLKSIFSYPRVAATCFFAALMVGPLEGFADVWAVAYLESVMGFTREVAASLPAMIYIGMCVGATVLPLVADKFKAYYGLIITSAIVMALAFGMIMGFSMSATVVGGVFFAVGVFSAYQIIAITLNSRNVPATQSGLVTSITNMVIMAFGSVFHNAIGLTMNAFWDGAMQNGAPVYDANAYIWGVSVIPVALGVALVGFAVMRKRHQN